MLFPMYMQACRVGAETASGVRDLLILLGVRANLAKTIALKGELVEQGVKIVLWQLGRARPPRAGWSGAAAHPGIRVLQARRFCRNR